VKTLLGYLKALRRKFMSKSNVQKSQNRAKHT
jgi:hypothetical protein